MLKTFRDYSVEPATHYRHAVKFHQYNGCRTGKAYNWLRNRTEEFSHNFLKANGEDSSFYIKDKGLAVMFALTWGGRVS